MSDIITVAYVRQAAAQRKGGIYAARPAGVGEVSVESHVVASEGGIIWACGVSDVTEGDSRSGTELVDELGAGGDDVGIFEAVNERRTKIYCEGKIDAMDSP